MASAGLTPTFVLTRTPLRVSLAGGGTDLPDFYEAEGGAVFNTAIDKYVYVTVKRHGDVFDEPIRLNYSRNERVQRIDEIENDITRECLRFLEVEPPIYISTVADLPASTGLGGSGSFAVGLLNALHAYRGERVSAVQLAEEASHVEIERLGQPIGKQDQYAAAFGGLNLFRFAPGGGVTVEPHRGSNGYLDHFFDHVLMFWTGLTRDASAVLAEQKENIEQTRPYLRAMREHALRLQAILGDGYCDPAAVGDLLHGSWQLKRQLAGGISNDQIDDWYCRAMDAGAIGGKLCGAGGGGFLLFLVHPEHRDAARQSLRGLTEVTVRHEAQGSQVLLTLGS